MLEFLEINVEELIKKTSKATRLLLAETLVVEEKMEIDKKKLIDYIKGNFTESELLFISYQWIAEKTVEILKNKTF